MLYDSQKQYYKDCEDKLKYFALCQISRCKFEIVDLKNETRRINNVLRKCFARDENDDRLCKCFAKNENDDVVLVYLEKSVTLTGFLKEIEHFLQENELRIVRESSLEFLQSKINNEIAQKKRGLRPKFISETEIEQELNRCFKLLDFLEQYKQTYYKLGEEIKGMTLYKIYSESPTSLNGDLRKMHDAKWIDYNGQLNGKTNIIHDEGICGLWSMKSDYAKGCIYSTEVKDHYGDRIFILEPIDDCYYFITNEEVIGDRYHVVGNYSLACSDDISKVKKLFETENP
jgi:hypothetical protein